MIFNDCNKELKLDFSMIGLFTNHLIKMTIFSVLQKQVRTLDVFIVKDACLFSFGFE
jgi:hypothetical protein